MAMAGPVSAQVTGAALLSGTPRRCYPSFARGNSNNLDARIGSTFVLGLVWGRMMSRVIAKVFLAVCLLTGTAGASTPGHAANALDGVTLRVIIAHKAGNTTDTMAR